MHRNRQELTKEQLAHFDKMKHAFLDNPLFKYIQKTVEEHNSMVERIQKDLAPTLEQIANLKKQMVSLEVKTPAPILYSRPVEYSILDELRELNRKKDTPKQTTQNEIVVVYDTTSNFLSRFIDGRNFSYDLSEDGKRKKMLDILTKQKTYMKTENLRDRLDCPTNQAVSKLAQTFNDYARVSLQLKKTKLIEGKKGSGYRINPRIIIQKE